MVFDHHNTQQKIQPLLLAAGPLDALAFAADAGARIEGGRSGVLRSFEDSSRCMLNSLAISFYV